MNEIIHLAHLVSSGIGLIGCLVLVYGAISSMIQFDYLDCAPLLAAVY